MVLAKGAYSLVLLQNIDALQILSFLDKRFLHTPIRSNVRYAPIHESFCLIINAFILVSSQLPALLRIQKVKTKPGKTPASKISASTRTNILAQILLNGAYRALERIGVKVAGFLRQFHWNSAQHVSGMYAVILTGSISACGCGM